MHGICRLWLQTLLRLGRSAGYYADMEHADVILLIGANIADNHPILCQRVDRTSPGTKPRTLVVVDPRVTKTAMMADIHLAVKPRSDIALLNGIATPSDPRGPRQP